MPVSGSVHCFARMGAEKKAARIGEYSLCICKSMHMNDPLGRKYRLECHRGLSHAAGCTLTYRF